MIRLDSTVVLQAVLSGAIATTQPQATVCASDHTSPSTYVGLAPVRTALNSTTDVTILAAPSAGTIRDVDYLSVFNRDTASVTITIKYDATGTDTIITTFTLLTLETLLYIHGAGWATLASSGAVKTITTLGGFTANAFLYSNATGAVTATAAATNGQLLIGSTSNPPVAATLTGTANQVVVTNGAGSVTLSTPQNIATSSSPTFVGLTLTGLLDISAAGAGQISFPATQNPSAGANVLDDYEEGTWTPSDQSGAALAFVNVVGNYIKIGRRVQALGQFQYPVTANGNVSTIGNLPFALISNANANVGVLCYTTLAIAAYAVGKAASGVTIGIYSNVTANLTNAQVSGSIFSTDTGYLTD